MKGSVTEKDMTGEVSVGEDMTGEGECGRDMTGERESGGGHDW